MYLDIFPGSSYFFNGKQPQTVFSEFTYSEDVNCLKSLSNEIQHTSKKVPVFKVKCPTLMTDRSQTYIGCTK